ncbi:MAG: type II toxin-antitoxin system RelB/DinJ family antitoxin [Oscillospiraceae bacterium]|nr:type II toxin-antitoxin system RelB/DinJ family antitoxin [Oscillospiraceae bacterium]
MKKRSRLSGWLRNTKAKAMSDAITLFLKQCVFYRGLPFDVCIPNEETLRAFAQSKGGEGLNGDAAVEGMLEELGI